MYKRQVYNYSVKVESDARAEVSLSKNNAVAGDKVVITVTPEQGQQVDNVTVTDANGREIAVTKVSDTQYSLSLIHILNGSWQRLPALRIPFCKAVLLLHFVPLCASIIEVFSWKPSQLSL